MRKLEKGLKKCVSPEAIESLLAGNLERQPIQQGCIEFVLVFIRGDNPDEVSEHVARVADLAVAHEAVVHDIIGGLVVVAFGTLSPALPDSRKRRSLVEVLRKQLADDLKIVHGAADGHYGLFGGESRMSYTFLVPHFDEMLGGLSRLKFGEMEEFRP
jgi:hypothetical protein